MKSLLIRFVARGSLVELKSWDYRKHTENGPYIVTLVIFGIILLERGKEGNGKQIPIPIPLTFVICHAIRTI